MRFYQKIGESLRTQYDLCMALPHMISVLVAEDNPVNQEVIIAMLQDYGVQTELVENGYGVVEAFTKKSYDLIFMDCQMPGMDGFEATSLIRNSNAANKNIPIIAMTAKANMISFDRVLYSGKGNQVQVICNLN
jgi:CheY-like chemotaxis protein